LAPEYPHFIPTFALAQLQQEFVIGTGQKGDSEAVGSVSGDGTRKWKMATIKGRDSGSGGLFGGDVAI
jgi:hypothetical protein